MQLLNFDPRSERIVLSQKRLKTAYSRQNPDQVPVVEPSVCAPLTTTKETLENMDIMLENAACWANNLAATDNDWPPVILGYCSVAMVPEAFGCELVFRPGESPWAKHAISNIQQVWSMKPKEAEQSPFIKRHFEWIDYSQRKLGTEVPMWTLDIQSPFSIAAQIVEPNELMTSCITKPKAVHHLCRMITDYSIEMMQKLLARTEHPGFPGANFPSISENIGLCVADDTPLIMLSPDMYREFAMPYNSQIGKIFGGVHIHSCGDYRHNLDNVLSITNIRSIQLHAGPDEFPLPETAGENCPFNRARKTITYFVDVNDVARGDEYNNRYQKHYLEYVLPRLCTDDLTGCILQSCGCSADSDLEEVNAALEWTRRHLSEVCKKR